MLWQYQVSDNDFGLWIIHMCHYVVKIRDVKRGQMLEAEVEAEARTLRLRPRVWANLRGRSQSRGKFKSAEQNNVLIEY